MATGRLGTADLTTGTIAISAGTPVYTVPAGNYAVFNVSFTNRSANTVNIRLAVSVGTTPDTKEYLEWQTAVVGYGVFERTGVVAGENLNVMASSSGTSVSVNVYGIETSTS